MVAPSMIKPGSLRARLHRTPPGYHYPIGRVLTIYGGLMIVVLLISLDQTIVATALPHIVGDLGGLSTYSWVFSAYLLCQTTTIPIYGKLGDLYGRRPMLLIAIGIFVAGSALCGAAQNMTELVVFRGLQGVGGGGLFSLALAVVGELVPPRDRGRYHGLFSSMFGAGAILGPAVGGLIVDNASWRWIFYVNVPVGGAAFAVIALTLPQSAVRKRHAVDYGGAALLAAGCGLLLLALVWAGSAYTWLSVQVLATLGLAVAVLVVFGIVERHVSEPILPFPTMKEPIVAAGAVATGLASMCMFGTVAFVPLFVQGVIGTSATSSGLVLTPLLLGTVFASISSGQWISRSGRYRANALIGPLVLGAGMFLLSQMDTTTTTAEAARNMVIAGVGTGLMMQVFLVAGQNAVPMTVIGSTTALFSFARGIGTMLGVTLFGMIVNQGLPERLRGRTVSHRLLEPARSQVADALQPAFLFATVACLAVFAIAFLWIEQRPLRRTLDDIPSAASVQPEAPGRVV